MVSALKETPAMCVRHWPENYPEIKSRANGTMRPAVPPSIFQGVPQGSMPTPPPPSTTTKRSSFEVRTAKDDGCKNSLLLTKLHTKNYVVF